MKLSFDDTFLTSMRELNPLPWVAHDVRGQPLQHEEHLGSAGHVVDVNTINAQYLLFSHANL